MAKLEPVPGHTPVIISKRKEANGVLVVVCRCCGDPSTDTSHTIHVLAGMTELDLQDKIQNIHVHNTHQHESMNLAEAYIEGIIVNEGNSSKAGK